MGLKNTWKGDSMKLTLEQIKQINVPVVNIGAFGRDGHTIFERVDMKHTFENVPNLTYLSVLGLLG